MPDAKTTLLVVLAVVAVGFVAFWWRALAVSARAGSIRPTPYELVVGFITDFFDTLGIGSFATTTSLYRARKTIDDRHLPGTLNVGHTIPTFVQAFLYTKSVAVDPKTLITMIAASVAGALLGAPIVSRWPRRNIQIGMGCALLALTGVLVYRQLHGDPTTGTDGLEGGLFGLGVLGNFALGALMTIGVGLYAPCLVMVSLLGMNPGTGFPIMMGSCAFLMPVASVPFVRNGCYAPRAALGLTLAGLPAVLVAHWWFEKLDINTVKWLVAAVVIYTAVTLLRAAARERPATPAGAA
jgi:uncharacterized membrane protein YfcA